MRVLHLCPLEWPVAVDSEGDVERALAGLLDALGHLGCESTALASGDSEVAGELIPVVDTGLADRPPPGLRPPIAYMHEVMWSSSHARRFDVIHCHIPMTGYVLGAGAEVRRRLLHTAHGPVSEGLKWLIRRHPGLAFTAVNRRASAELRRAGAAGCRVIGEVEPDRARMGSGEPSRIDSRVIAAQYLDCYQHIARATRGGTSSATPPARRVPMHVGRGRLRVLHLGLPFRRISSDATGGIEALLAHLIPALEPLGCESTLLAGAGSRVEPADVVPLEQASDLPGPGLEEPEAHSAHAVMEAVRRGTAFEVIHNHYRHAFLLSAVEDLAGRVLHTLHHPASPSLCWLATRHPQMRFAVPSEFQAQKLRAAGLTLVHVVPNGVDLSAFPFRADPEGQLAFLGVLNHHKGPDIALQVAAAAKLPIRLAGPVDNVNRHFFDTRIRPLLNGSARYLGVLGPVEKAALLGGSSCLVMPSRWDEPFGMVAVEAMACGTPVVGLSNGALPEIVEEGVGGYLATAPEEMAELVHRACRLDRRRVRAYATARFDISLTARRYAELYREIAGR